MSDDELEQAYAEIKYLREALESVSDHGCAAERMEFIRHQGTEIERLKALLSRAAAALDDICADQGLKKPKIIAELRKAAE